MPFGALAGGQVPPAPVSTWEADLKKDQWGKRGRPKPPPFVFLPWLVLNSMAYRDLSPSAAKLLPFLLGKARVEWRDPDRLRIEFEYSITEAQRNGGLARATAQRAIHALHKHGFLEVVRRGKAFEDLRVSSKFKLSARWERYGTPDFKVITWKDTPGGLT